MNWLQQHGLSIFATLAVYLVSLEILYRAFRPKKLNFIVFPPILRVRLLTWLWLGLWGNILWDVLRYGFQAPSAGNRGGWALFLLPLVAFLSWPGTVVVTEEGIEQFRVWRIWRRFVPWNQVARVDYRWVDRTVPGWGRLIFVDGFRTTVRTSNGSAVVHSARNENMPDFDKLLRQRLPSNVFSESAKIQ